MKLFLPCASMITISGTLYKILEERIVGKRGWKVRDFVIKYEAKRGDRNVEQFRLLQAGGGLIRDLVSIPHGAKIICELNLLGKECSNKESSKENTPIKYRNLDEVISIYVP